LRDANASANPGGPATSTNRRSTPNKGAAARNSFAFKVKDWAEIQRACDFLSPSCAEPTRSHKVQVWSGAAAKHRRRCSIVLKNRASPVYPRGPALR